MQMHMYNIYDDINFTRWLLTDFELTLYSRFAALSVVDLSVVVVVHYFDKFLRECRVLFGVCVGDVNVNDQVDKPSEASRRRRRRKKESEEALVSWLVLCSIQIYL